MLMGYGAVVKIVFGFKHAFWNEEGFRYQCAQIPNLGFLLNDTPIPIFWSFSNDREHRITGWVGGARAEEMINISDEDIFDITVTALASALVCTEDLVMEMMDFHYVFNWGADYFSKGAYSYETPQSPMAKALLRTPLEGTLFFAGEALGDTSGTVEAALESARDVVTRIVE